MTKRLTHTDRLESMFRARAGAWIDGRELARVGGVYAWRSRLTDLRRRGMTIENRQRTVRSEGGVTLFRVSEYRWMPTSLLDIAAAPAEAAQEAR
jgi:hypothetical protein